MPFFGTEMRVLYGIQRMSEDEGKRGQRRFKGINRGDSVLNTK
jgi:hypothetical protein